MGIRGPAGDAFSRPRVGSGFVPGSDPGRVIRQGMFAAARAGGSPDGLFHRPVQKTTWETALEIKAMAIEVIPIRPTPHE